MALLGRRACPSVWPSRGRRARCRRDAAGTGRRNNPGARRRQSSWRPRRAAARSAGARPTAAETAITAGDSRQTGAHKPVPAAPGWQTIARPPGWGRSFGRLHCTARVRRQPVRSPPGPTRRTTQTRPCRMRPGGAQNHSDIRRH